MELERQNRIEDANLARLLDDVDELAARECNINVGSQWNFETNVNEQTQQESVSSKEIQIFFRFIYASNTHTHTLTHI